MNDTDFQNRVMVLCEEALSFEPEERAGFLEKKCADSPELRAAVEKLISTVNRTDEFLRPASEEAELVVGDMVGDYRVVSNLGRGGMGTVYLAERVAEGYSQRVALKVMRTFLQSNDMISRFNEERRILARLHHPYIATLMDGGTTDQGLPYLVTELVEGVPIDTYCDSRELTVNQRLDLVQKVALALQSAHQNLVVHSDLKPGNILITDDGIPKLLDFGVAKLVTPVVEGEESVADDKFIALTPEYASPEQIVGEPVTTTSDVYSLGVLTYKLLVGETPHKLEGAPRDELVKHVENRVVNRPSQHVLSLRDPEVAETVAGDRKSTMQNLSRKLSGDLDAVLFKALQRDPLERYPSALVFATELKSYLRGLPVTAIKDSNSYRLAKFVKRNRVSVAAGALGLLALVGGLTVSMWQAHIASKRFDDLYGLAETVIYDLHDEIADLPGGTQARQLMTRESLHYLDRLAKDSGGDRALQLDLSKAYKRLGDVLGNPTNANLGDVGSSVDSYNKALVIAQQLSSGVQDDPSIERHKAIVHEKLGDVLAWTGDFDGALEHSAKSMELFESLVGNSPDNAIAIQSVSISGVKRGDLLGHPSFPNVGRTAEALKSYQQALATIEPLAKKEPVSKTTMRYYALAHERVGTMLSLNEDFEQALVNFETSLAIRQEMVADDPANTNARRDAGIAKEKIGDVRLASGNPQAALPHYLDALLIYRSLAKLDPENVNAARTLAFGLGNVAEALVASGKPEDAVAYFDELLDIRQALASQNPENVHFQTEYEEMLEQAKVVNALLEN
ncbi:MAG: protein kinase [Gammaproteobacteria bacterium]